jgi:hypothetical protein
MLATKVVAQVRFVDLRFFVSTSKAVSDALTKGLRLEKRA